MIRDLERAMEAVFAETCRLAPLMCAAIVVAAAGYFAVRIIDLPGGL
jgi:hypothetical protein